MDELAGILSLVNGFIWQGPVLLGILGVGLLLNIQLQFIPVRKLGYGIRLLWQGRRPNGPGDISPFSALMTSLSATVGTGNIAGVATAISIGGPGALFWMWMTALFGMATKYSEAVLAVRYREQDAEGRSIGGPMYYIRNGMGKKWFWLAGLFAFFGAVAGFGIGNMVQSNAIADALDDRLHLPPVWTSVLLGLLVGAVLLGGVKRIAWVATGLVPIMALSYVAAGLIFLGLHIPEIPGAVMVIVKSAFTGEAAAGGFAGSTFWLALQFGVARGIFSNEAGLGSAPIAHAAAQTESPVQQGSIAMLGTFIDTLILCSITGLAIVISGVWTTGETSVDLTALAFGSVLPFGEYIVAFSLVVFAFTTILGWSYYGERCWQYLFGAKRVVIYRILWVIAVMVGPLVLLLGDTEKAGINFIWLLADTLNGLMALPNLIALVVLSPVVAKLTYEYYRHRSN
ncbi:MAG: alanine/glycine:cation symporter family protein [Gammaproteobacteria bacterium]